MRRMQAQPQQRPQPPPRWPLDSRGSLGHRVVAATRRAWTRYWTHRAARATVGILHRLDDRALKDIGLNRSEIESVAYCDCRRNEARMPERRACMC